MNFESTSLKTKISIFTLLIILASIVLTSFFFIFWTTKNIKENVKNNNLNLAISISKSTDIGDLIREKDPNGQLQSYALDISTTLTDVDLLVIADMNKVRYTHPKADRIGKTFVGGDEDPIIKNPTPYTSEAEGTLGKSLRAFAPIFDSNGDQTGFVAVGTFTNRVLSSQKDSVTYVIIFSLMGILLGAICSVFLSINIKESLLGLEPDEISMLYLEKESILDSLQEALIATDSNNNITMINKPAKAMFNITDDNPIGKNIKEFIDSDALEVLLSLGTVNQKEELLNDMEMVINISPINHNNGLAGNITTFKDRSETRRLAEEITGYNQIVTSLRAKNHEFKNKLHVILGLIHIEKYDEAKEYILGLQKNDQIISNKLVQNINNPTIVALIYGKISRANELEVTFDIDETSNLEKTTIPIYNRSLVTIIGNLLDNAMEAVIDNDIEKKVKLSIHDSNSKLEIIVSDNGKGINNDDLSTIFDRGYTTKQEGNGIGLALVKEKVDFFDGTIYIDSTLNKGTTITAMLPKEDQ